MKINLKSELVNLFLFSIFCALICYGFGLTNYALTVDSEYAIQSDISLSLGRWGTNLVRYHIFEGQVPYFTMLLGLFFLSAAAAFFTRLLKFGGVYGYLFCALFVTFPQMAYQLAFTMQADVVPIGFFCSALALIIFEGCVDKPLSLKTASFYLVSAVLLMFVISIYQALIFVPVIIYLLIIFQNLVHKDFLMKEELFRAIKFALLMILAGILYFISVKVICPPIEGGYLSSYVSGAPGNRFSDFWTLWKNHLMGKNYYGEKLFWIVPVLSVGLILRYYKLLNVVIYRILLLVLILLIPFLISFFITNGYNPPRIYLASGIVFAFTIVQFAKDFKAKKIFAVIIAFICIANVYYITMLFNSSYKIYEHDKELARKMDNIITTKFPSFNPEKNYVYFYGGLPWEHHDKLRLPNSEVFGGSIFFWDDGSNFRIINMFRFNDVAYYKMIDSKEVWTSIKDSLDKVPIWPDPESIQMINNVVVVKLNSKKGSPLSVE